MPLSKIVANSITDNAITTDQIADTSVHGRRNLVINGSMAVAQRGTTFTTPASGTDILDRFSVLANANGASKVTYSQSTDAPEGFRNSLKLDVVTALSSLAAGDYHILKYNGFEQQDIDHLAFGSSDAKQITMSFWVKSNKTGTLAVEFQYTSVESSNSSVELAKLYTINAANTWEYKTLTWPAPTGHTSSQSAANGVGLRLYMWITAGSTYAGGTLPTDWGVNSNRVAGQDNYLDSTSNEIYFTGLQIEAGDKATPFEHRSFADQLYSCKRYFQKSFNYDAAPANGGATGVSYSGGILGYSGTNNNGALTGFWQFSPEMRATPTVTKYGNSSSQWGYMSAPNSSTSWSAGSGYLSNTQASGVNFGQNISGDTHMFGFGHMTVDAEL